MPSSVETVSVMRLHRDMDESGYAAIEEIVPGLIEKLGYPPSGTRRWPIPRGHQCSWATSHRGRSVQYGR